MISSYRVHTCTHIRIRSDLKLLTRSDPTSARLRIRITLLRIRIQLFVSMRIRIQLFISMRIQILILPLICDHWFIDPPALYWELPWPFADLFSDSTAVEFRL